VVAFRGQGSRQRPLRGARPDAPTGHPTACTVGAAAFGVRDVRIGRASGRFTCEIVDPGPGFDEPAAGYLAPRPGCGSGLWIARQLTWQIDFFQAAAGFTARIVL
jgi:hypothetical protein